MTMKPIFATVALLLFSFSTLYGQNNERALAAGIDTIVRTSTMDDIVDKIVDEIYEKHGKTAYLATRIAKSYYNYNEKETYNSTLTHKLRHFHKQDTARAFKYINLAVSKEPKCGEAYVLACNILDYDGQTEEGIKWLKRGMDINPQDSSLCLAEARILARTDVNAAVAKLEEYKKINPSFPVNLHIARIYNDIDIRGNQYRDKVAEFYGKNDMSNMTRGDVETYVMSLFYSGQNAVCNEKAEEALHYFPRSLALNRFYFRSLVPLKKYKDALIAFDNLKNAEDAIIELRDSINYAAALAGVKDYNNAMALYDIILAKPDLSENDWSTTNTYVNQCMASQVKAFTDMGEYNKAIDVYKAFVDKRRAEGKLIDDIIMNYANIYLNWALELNGDEKITVLLKADKILEEAVSISKDNDVYFSYIRLKNIYFQIDGKAETGAAVPCIEQLESLILSKGKISDVNKKRLIDGYRYMMPYYAFAKNDNKKALEYANKILELDPTHDGATKFRDAMKRAHR